MAVGITSPSLSRSMLNLQVAKCVEETGRQLMYTRCLNKVSAHSLHADPGSHAVAALSSLVECKLRQEIASSIFL